MKTYVTFGQDHKHIIEGVVYDKDCVAVIESDNLQQSRDMAYSFFGTKFCFAYQDRHPPGMYKFYPRGFIEVGAK